MNNVLHRVLLRIAVVLGLVVFASAPAWSQTQLSAYQFYYSTTATANSMTGASTALGSGYDDTFSGYYSIGFNFVFCGTTYSTFGVCSNGYISLGSSSPGVYLSQTFGSTNYSAPVIVGMGRDLHTGSDGYINYVTTGSSPNRVLTVEFKTRNYPGSGQATTAMFQIRLYETSNALEIYYSTNSGSIGPGQIGAWASGSNYASITSSTPPSISYSSGNASSSFPSSGTSYTLTPCNGTTVLVGDLSQGGTTNMANGDTLMNPTTITCGASGTYQPFTVSNGNGCSARNYTLSVTGGTPGEFTISPTSGNLPIGSTVKPTITVTPQGAGTRSATLTVSDDGGLVRSYLIRANVVSPLVWIGNLPQGGTATMTNGDTLLLGKIVPRLGSQAFTPFSVQNTSGVVTLPISYTMSGPYAAEYVVTGPSTIGPSSTITPTITFNPTGVGVENATLKVTIGCETRNYPLAAFSAAPGAEFRINTSMPNVRGLGINNSITASSELFYFDYQCTGESVSRIPVGIYSTGNQPLQITKIEFREIDTTVAQGTGPYPLTGKLLKDYQFTIAPGVAPLAGNTPMSLPVTIPAGTQQPVYLNFVPQVFGKRYARVFVFTNAQNFTSAANSLYPATLGLLIFDVYGRGNGAKPVSLGQNTIQPINCPDTHVGDSVDVWSKITNVGLCDLRIDSKKLQIFSGDVDPQPREFSIVTPFASAKDANGNYVIAPGGVDSILVRFNPVHVGIRRGWIRLQTNDSTFSTNGNTERGAYYWDVVGNGTSNLGIVLLKDGSTIFPAGVIDGPATEKSIARAELRNTLPSAITVTSITITGPDAADFTIDASTPLPTLPKLMTPAEILKLTLLFKPASGSQPGVRTAYLQVVLENGDTVRAVLSAEAGTRILTANPASLFDTEVVPVGGLLRRIVEVKNTGTLPLTLSTVMITGADSLSYGITPMARNILAGGQTEYVEVTFKPVAAGTTVAKFEASGNQTNGVQSVTLGGKGVRTKGKVDPSGVTSQGTDVKVPGVQISRPDNAGGQTKGDAEIKFNK